ncbi:alpha/beta fold hydrolase [Streptacidiphilus rugosus]|uniref:alpha/beta fold hydrolase n=1 Tax=Streptacidiphilus rugosus TaxID=405783 RepID=UPI00056D76AD|nr:alpha/beta hydrolase [Streptacidiphilus rugosus]
MTADLTTTSITTKDGTSLVVDAVGDGVPVVLIGGAFNDRSTVAQLGAELAGRFTVVTYDRRGRGASDDRASEYLVANEVDDLAAVLGHVGGRASVFGHSSGAALALEGAMHGLPMDRIAVYEPSFRADESLPHADEAVYERLKALVAAGDRDGAAVMFLGEVIGVPADAVAEMKAGPAWAFLADKAPSLPYDVLVSAPWQLLPSDRLAALTLPLLAIYGDQTSPGLAAATKTVAKAVPGAVLTLMPGEDHTILQSPAALADILAAFFA